MNPTTFAVISDLHIGDEARAKDLCPHKGRGTKVDTQFKSRFLSFLSENDLVADYLIIPGDVTNEADFAEVELASDFIGEVSAKLNVDIRKIVFVPGNHDIDWEVLKLGNNPVRKTQRYDTISYDGFIFNQLLQSGEGHVLQFPFLSFSKVDNLVVVGYNSSWHDSPEEALHCGILDDSHISKLEEFLSRCRSEKNLIKLFLVHHHPIFYGNPIPGYHEFSQMQNCDKLLKLLTKYRFDFVIHGHTHQPNFQTNAIDSSFPIGIFSAGSFSIELPSLWRGKVNNQFHIIRVDDRDSKTSCLLGEILSWTYYYGHGWIPSSRSRDGITHNEPFGVYFSPDDINDLLRSLIDKLFSTKDWIDKSMLVAAEPTIKYMRPLRVMEALEELSSILNFDIIHDNIDEVILLKN